MYAVEVYAAVRRFVFVEGRSRREAAKVFGLSRDTIQKICAFSAPPGYQRSKPPVRPLPIREVVPAAEVDGPAAALTDEVRALHARFHGGRR